MKYWGLPVFRPRPRTIDLDERRGEGGKWSLAKLAREPGGAETVFSINSGSRGEGLSSPFYL